jgi:hypothetical protein
VDPVDPDIAAEQILARAEAGAIESGIRDESRRKAARREQTARDDGVLSEIHRLEAEVRHLRAATLRPRNGFLRLFIRDLETNPHSQYKIHRYGAYWWLLNMPAVAVLFFLAPGLWLKWGVFIILEYSIYSNMATDYGAMSASIAAYGDRRSLPPIPGAPFTGGHGGRGGPGGQGGSGGTSTNGQPGEPGKPGLPGEEGEPGTSGASPAVP